MAETTKPAEKPVKAAKPSYTKEQLKRSKAYADNTDLLEVVLDDGGSYSRDEVEKRLNAFKKRRV